MATAGSSGNLLVAVDVLCVLGSDLLGLTGLIGGRLGVEAEPLNDLGLKSLNDLGLRFDGLDL